jgi:NitT/TauT family transport system substrate-binding protein
MPKILARLSFTLIFALALQGGASAATKIKLLYTAAPPFLASFVAQDQGFFSKRSLDVDFELVATGGVIIPALVGGSGQIGGPTVTVLLQANEAGLEVLARLQLQRRRRSLRSKQRSTLRDSVTRIRQQ